MSSADIERVSTSDAARVRRIVEEMLARVHAERPAAPAPVAAAPARPAKSTAGSHPTELPDLTELTDPTDPGHRRVMGVDRPASADGLRHLMAATGARIGVGRAGPRPRTRELLLFQADHAVTQDAIFSEVPQDLLDRYDLFTVDTKVTDRAEYLLRPDLGRELSEQARATLAERCVKKPDVQIVVADGLSALAVTDNLPAIYPVLVQGLTAAGVSLGTPFFVHNARVGVMNDINEIIGADAVVMLIGERPGLGVADALSAYSGWRPGVGKNDAHRDVVCMITDHGGTNPLEAGAFVVDHLRTVLERGTSGVELRLQLQQERR